MNIRRKFFPLCGKTPKTFSIVWKKSAFFSTPWKTAFQSVEYLPAVGFPRTPNPEP
jgi:hypothetical protein